MPVSRMPRWEVVVIVLEAVVGGNGGHGLGSIVLLPLRFVLNLAAVHNIRIHKENKPVQLENDLINGS